MFNKPFVVLDVETTGFYPETDKIIEIGCVRYEKGKEKERFESLIRIDKEIPPLVSLITGIRNEDLEKAPSWDDIKERVQQIVKGAVIVGHNINFDKNFLKTGGIDFGEGLSFDTVPLAQIAFPAAVSHSLESLTDELEIRHEDKHRAMSDTEATLGLFKMIWDQFSHLPRAVIDELKKYLDRSDWAMKPFFEEIKGKSGAGLGFVEPIHELSLQNTQTRHAPPRALSVNDVFGKNGFLAKSWDHYEPRPQQHQMAGAVTNAFEHEYHLIVEAPTGIGKSLAYLVPAAQIALEKKQRVVIATHTITLQHQLFEKDLERLRAIYQAGAHNPNLEVAVLKGRGNYLCAQRVREFKKRAHFNVPELTLLLKIITWPFFHPEGDMSDMTLTREERMVWDFEMSAASKSLRGGKCCKNADCYFQQALQKAKDAPIVIVNHALLMADLVMSGGLLPEYEYLVIDEAHNFEEVATRAYGESLTQEHVTIPIKSIHAHLMQLKRKDDGTLFSQHEAFREIDPMLVEATELLQKTDNLFSLIGLFVSRHVPPSDYQESLLIDRALLGSEEWFNLGDSVNQVVLSIQEWLKKISRFGEKLQAAGGADQEEFVNELTQEVAVIQEQLTKLNPFFMKENVEEIRFFTSSENGAVVLTSLPLLVGEHLKNDLYGNKKSIVLTSATLSTPLQSDEDRGEDQKPFDYLRKMLGLDTKFEELILDSPFDYEKQALMILPTDLPDVRNQESLKPVAELIQQVAVATQGRMLGLFTSYRNIEHLFVSLSAPLAQKGINVLAQRFSGGRNKILRAFLNNPVGSILLGTSSFWEGIDIPGDDLIAVMIHKLPFDIPSDPLHKVRSQMFENGFYQYTMPRAMLRFKQGFGRLIRSQKDTGVMIMLDSALTKKDYGKFFLKCLPKVPVEKMKLAEIPELVKKWLKLQKIR